MINWFKEYSDVFYALLWYAGKADRYIDRLKEWYEDQVTGSTNKWINCGNKLIAIITRCLLIAVDMHQTYCHVCSFQWIFLSEMCM